MKDFCDSHQLWLIEDNCDALGARYFLNGEWRNTGTFGHIGTSSFYPAHHITMGEGGAVYTNDARLHRIVNSLRDWGRDCSCPPGVDNTCKHRFDKQFGDLPRGYDHKYVYSHFGYNLKVTEMQAAVGCAQLLKLRQFIAKRIENWEMLREGLAHLEQYFIFQQATANSMPSWFGFLLTIKQEARFNRHEIVEYLENAGVQTRNFFAGNLLKHPCSIHQQTVEAPFRVIGDLPITNLITDRSFWIGVYPGIGTTEIAKIITIFNQFVEERCK